MSLLGALNASQTALAVDQAALQTTGNNIANAADPTYTRETAIESPSDSQQIKPGIFVGTGVDLVSVQRQVDDSLNARLRNAASDSSAAGTTEQWLSQVETAVGGLSNNSLSTASSTFFNDWSTLANSPTDTGQRQVVLQDGANLASQYQNLSGQLGALSTNVNNELSSQASAADALTKKIAQLNGQIVVSEAGTGGQANDLRDTRDADLQQLSQLVNINTVPQANGSVNVFVGTEPLINATTSNGIQLSTTEDANGTLQKSFTFKSNNGTIPATSGQLSALVNARTQIDGVSTQIDTLAHNLIFELNKLHSSGQGTDGYTSVSSTNPVADPTAALNSTGAALAFTPTNGSFVVHVKNTQTGLSTSTLVNVDLTGSPTDTTLNSLATSLNGVSGVTATVNGGKLTLATSSANEQISFSQDSSGALAALGINSFFTGTNASNIAVNSTLTADPGLVAAAKNGDSGDNQTAVAISQLSSAALTGLGGQSLDLGFQAIVNQVGATVSAAKQTSTATQTILTTLTTQQQSLSGVSLNEETVNLMQQQRAFQAAAKVVTAVDAMLQTLLTM